MGKWGALPTWLLTKLLLAVWINRSNSEHCRKHAWRGRKFTLADWHAHETPMCRYFDATFFSGIALIIVGISVVVK
jgi:hypothetical protein